MRNVIRALAGVAAVTALFYNTLAYTAQLPDTTPPSVAVTAPALDALVHGVATVTASASDDTGVAGVQFVLNGELLGAEDTTAPYTIAWNTSEAYVGSHLLSARARDAAGNMGDSELHPVVVIRSSSPPREVIVPNVVDQAEGAATTTLTNAGLTVGTVSTANSPVVALGNIISQNPAAGATVSEGSAVALVRSLGPANVWVPDVVSMTEAAAQTAITNANLTVGPITSEASANVPVGNIIRQVPTGGTSVAPGTSVALVKSAGPAPQENDDTTGPISVAPVENYPVSVIGSTVALRLAWSGADEPGGSGLARYELQRSTNGGGTWSNVTLSSALASSIIQTLTPGTTYTYRVRAVDVAGNTGGYATGTPFTPTLTQENASSIVYTGTWATDTVSTASGGAQRFASAAGATATFTFTGNTIAWVAVRASDRGQAEVFIDGVSAGIVGLFQTSTTPSMRRIMFERRLASGGQHTIQIRVLGTKASSATGTRVDVDAFLTSTTSAAPTGISVPNVVGMTEAAARSALAAANLTVGLVTAANSSTVPAGSIISQDPVANTLVPASSQVALVIAAVVEPAFVPDVVGQTEAAARSAITGAGYTVGTVTTASSTTVPSGSVISQNPTAGSSAAAGSAISFVTSSGGPATTGDSVPPTAVPPIENIPVSIIGSTVAIRIAWSGTDNAGGSGMARFELQRSTNGGGTWSNVTLPSVLATSIIETLTPGTNYTYRVRAVDVAGNVGTYATGAAFTPSITQENAATGITYSGTWTNETISSASGGAQRFASTAGASTTFTFTGNSVAWVAVRANNRGRAEVFVDGVSAGIVDLFQTSTTPSMRRVMFERRFATSGTHTIQIRVLGTKASSSTGTRVDLDAFVVTR